MEQQAQGCDSLYRSLDPELRQARLFTLLPGTSKDPIKGFLTKVSLETDPDYEALSYVWGDPTVTLPIHLGASGPDSSTYVEFSVTTNLESALRRFRLDDASRCLWIDAICINQLDIVERNHQVKNMKWVYVAASRVLVWLGGDFTVYSSRGLNILSDLMTKDGVFNRGRDKITLTQHYGSGISQTQQYINDILDRVYWQRMWVIQEFALAKRVLLVCGPFAAELPAEGCLERIKCNIQMESSTGSESAWFGPSFSRLRHILNIQEERRASRALCLWELVWRFRSCDSYDPRDKVFALLGMVSDSELFENTPDYSLNLETIRYRLVRSSIQLQGNLNILNWARGPSTDTNHPSWLFHFSKTNSELESEELLALHFVPVNPTHITRFRTFEASKTLRPTITGSISTSSQLRVRGFTIDVITYLGPRSQYDSLRNKIVDRFYPNLDHFWRSDMVWKRFVSLWPLFQLWINEIERGCFVSQRSLFQRLINKTVLHFQAKAVSPYSSSDSKILTSIEIRTHIREAFWRTISADSIVKPSPDLGVANGSGQTSYSTRPDESFGQMGELLFGDNKLDVNMSDTARKERFGDYIDDFIRAIVAATTTRQFFRTDSGWFGLAPEAAIKGDILCVLLGGVTPFVLRPIGNNLYQLIGDCYVHGIMDGEAMSDLSNGKYKLQDFTMV